MQEINALGVPCFVGSCSEVYREQAFVKQGLAPESPLPVARELGDTSLAFLVDPAKTTDDMQRAAQALLSVVRDATRAPEQTEKSPAAAE